MSKDTDERNLGHCCVCERDQHPSQVTEYSPWNASTDTLVVCHECIEEFERDCDVKVESDVMGAEVFSRLEEYCRVESKDEPYGRIDKLEIKYANGELTTVHFRGTTAYIKALVRGGAVTSECSADDYCKALRRDILGLARNQTLKEAKLGPPELRVAEALAQDGYGASYEFPGYVHVNHASEVFAFGTADDFWSGHGLQIGGESCEPCWQSTIPSSVTEPEQISNVVEWIKSCLDAPRKR